MLSCQIVSLAYDADSGILSLRLSDESSYQVTNAGHALAIKDSVSPGGILSPEQRQWLERYRVQAELTNREALIARLRMLRAEIQTGKGL